MDVHDKIQPGGVCWDCGAEGARPVAKWRWLEGTVTGLKSAGWRCESCNRWWPVLPGDLSMWARAITARLEEPWMGESPEGLMVLQRAAEKVKS